MLFKELSLYFKTCDFDEFYLAYILNNLLTKFNYYNIIKKNITLIDATASGTQHLVRLNTASLEMQTISNLNEKNNLI